MKVLVVSGRTISAFPPIRNLIKILVRNGHKVTVITRDSKGTFFPEMEHINYIVIPDAKNVRQYLSGRRLLRMLVKKHMQENDVLWTTTDSTVRDLGKCVLDYPHIMQMMELIEDIPALPRVGFIGLNIKRYAKHAKAIVVPEINRAYIQKSWWNLAKTPYVLPNKMDLETIENIPDYVMEIIKEIKTETRKIVLYQGIFASDRNLDKFADAIDELDDEYCLFLMGEDSEYRQRLCNEHKNIKYLGYIQPPYHLLITKYAQVGLLPYSTSKQLAHYSILNALYCAPNKIFEYAACGLPMIGSDVLGLRYPFEQYGIGYVCETQSKDEIKEAIKNIICNYDKMKDNCKEFYNSVDMDAIVNRILEESICYDN